MKRFLVCSVVMAAVLSMGLVLIHCGGGGDDKECENNQDCETLHGTGWWCDRTLWECKELTCVPDCAGKCGGDDGCESTCPNLCPADYECNTDTWICDFTGCTTTADCQQDQCCLQSVCRDKACGVFVCGPDPVCGLDCGTCGAGTHCSAGACVQDVACTSDADCLAGEECCIGTPLTCTPKACGALECGPDPTCGIECGPCVAPQTCSAGQCVTQGSGALGDPCAFGDVNITAGACNAGLECLGIPADGTSAGTCPGGASSECTTLIEEWNPDCVNGNCGASFCSEACGVGDTCPTGFVPQDVSGNCMCVPGSSGAGQQGDPCPWDTVNASYDECEAGMACLGNDDIGSCPGGTDAECTGVAGTWNPNCVAGVCGFSFCSGECDAGGNCDTGFNPADVSGDCYCVPDEAGTSQAGEPCPFGDMNSGYDFCASGLSCLGNDDAGTCPGGTAAECGIPDVQNPDCVAGVCGFSHCTARCDAQGNCETGFVPETVGGTCYCVPGEPGTAQLGDPCPFGDVNDTAENCAPGLSCLGFPADGAAGTCPGGNPTECTQNDPPIPANQNPDCVGGNCGASFCSEPCDALGNCPAGYAPEQVGDPPTCYCVPG